VEGDRSSHGENEHGKHQNAAAPFETIAGFPIAHRAGDIFIEKTGQKKRAEENARNSAVGSDTFAPGAQPADGTEDADHKYDGHNNVGPILAYAVENAVDDFHNRTCCLVEKLFVFACREIRDSIRLRKQPTGK